VQDEAQITVNGTGSAPMRRGSFALPWRALRTYWQTRSLQGQRDSTD
jgi:hypothetical protein